MWSTSPPVVDQLRAVLGDAAFDQCAAIGPAMDLADAVGYARHHIELTRCETTPMPAANSRHRTPRLSPGAAKRFGTVAGLVVGVFELDASTNRPRRTASPVDGEG
jgi:hypothetical protein